MGTQTSYVQSQLVYWAQITAAGAITVQNGPGALTVGVVASVYTITLPANFTIPINRRFIALTPVSAAGGQVQYDEAGSAAGTVVVRGFTGAGAAGDVAFQIAINRISLLP